MQKVTALAILGAAAGLSACVGSNEERHEAEGPAQDRSYQLAGFDRIEVAGSYDVDVRTGAAQSVRATGPQKALDRMTVEVRDGKLLIHPKQERRSWGFGNFHTGHVRLQVTVPRLSGAEVAGSGDVRVDRVAGDSFEGHVAGSGGIDVGQVEVRQLKLGIAGSGNATAGGGRADNVELSVAGSGDIRAGNVVSRTAAVSVTGSGDVAVQAADTAAVQIAGSGDVNLTGGATCTVSKAGSGDVRCS